jgi:HK97 family phage portal protein
MWPFRKKAERRSLFNIGGYAPGAFAGATANSAQQLSAVWACIRLLSDSLSTLPLDVFRDGPNGREPLELPPVLVSPAADWTMQQWLEGQVRSLLLDGNGYALVVARDATMRPSQLEPLDPGGVTVAYEGGRLVRRVNGKQVDRADLWHLRAFCQAGSPVGLSPIAHARMGINLGLSAEEFGWRFFASGSLMGGLLETDQELEDDDAEALKARWNDKLAGLGKAHEIAVLDRGAKYRPITLPNDQAQFLETRKFQVAEICRLFGVPPEMIAADSGDQSTYANIEARSLYFATYALRPWLVKLETALGTLLPRGQYVRFNSGALLKTTLLQRYQAHQIALAAGFMTVAEVRRLEDLPPIEQAAA